MHYPWWYVPVLTAPMLVAVIAVVHVIVSHYAVGGGILLALENQFSIKTGNDAYRQYLHQHAKFFVLLTVAFGAITGVGIWWTIALTSPLATEFLIRTFVFGWAIEWVFFIIEIVAAFIMFYHWTKLPPKTHIQITWIYALAAWISLVLITGITAFMLDSRGLFGNWAGSGFKSGCFWQAFFNVQFLPQTFTRTGGALFLSALYVLLHAAWIFRNDSGSEIFNLTVKRMSRYIIAGAVLAAAGVLWGGAVLSPAARLTMERAVLMNILVCIFFGVCGLLAVLSLFGLRNPRQVNLAFAVCLFIFGVTALGSAEFMREALRKPWIVDKVVLGNQIYADEITERQKTGFLSGKGTAQIKQADTVDRPVFSIASQITVSCPNPGGAVFMYHCNNCHALEHGISAVAPLLVGESKDEIKATVRKLNQPVMSMPPWCGTEEELDALAEFLLTIRPEKP